MDPGGHGQPQNAYFSLLKTRFISEILWCKPARIEAIIGTQGHMEEGKVDVEIEKVIQMSIPLCK